MWRVVMGLLLCLAACAAPTVDGTELGGVATWTDSPTPGTALRAADAHCQRYGRVAKATQVNPLGYLTFSCEKP